MTCKHQQKMTDKYQKRKITDKHQQKMTDKQKHRK